MTSEVKTENVVSLKEINKNGKTYLQFDFVGHLDLEAAMNAIADWKGKVASDKKVNLIYNCLEMTGFDTSARKIWQSAMSELKAKTGSIWIISSNNFILAAAKTMGLLTGFEIRIAKSLDAIKN